MSDSLKGSLHVVIVSTPRDWGGGEEQARLLACGLRRRGHAVTMVARQDGQLAARLEADGFDVVGFPGRGRSLAAKRLGIGDRVRFLGFRQDVPDLIHACDLFVLPSHTEGLCSTLIDVMLAGRPIVTTSAGGIPDLIDWGQPETEPVAWCVPPRDSPALSAAILDALASSGRSMELARQARDRAKRLFTADVMVESTLDVYRDVIRGKRRFTS